MIYQRENVSNQEAGSDGNPTNINEEPDITFDHIVTIEMGDEEAGEPAEESEQDYYYSVLDKFHRKMYEAIRTQILHKNTRSYRWIGNYKHLQADSRDNYNRLIRNGEYLYIVNCRRDLAKIMGWEMATKF